MGTTTMLGTGEEYPNCISAGPAHILQQWEENGVTRRVMTIFGEPVYAVTEEYPRGVLIPPKLVTLYNDEVEIWERLHTLDEVRGHPSLGMLYFLVYILSIIVMVILGVYLAYKFGANGTLAMEWYFRYPLFIIGGIILGPLALGFINRAVTFYKLTKLSFFVRKLPKRTGRDMNYYREVFRKLGESDNPHRAWSAKALLRYRLI